MNIFYEYIKYLFTAEGRFSFHSPFVYDFKDKCMKVCLNKDFLKQQKQQIHALHDCEEVFETVDFGSGSKKMNLERKVSTVLKNAATKGVYLDLLSQMVAYYQPKEILELGTSLGVGTFALSYGKGKVTTVEGCPKTQDYAKRFMPDSNHSIQFINERFDVFIPQDETIYDLIFIDGHHDGEALKKYLKLLDKNMHDETIIILDDIRWSKGMLSAWKEIQKDTDFHLSMDLFKFGIVVKRHHQHKQHFVVKVNHIIKSML